MGEVEICSAATLMGMELVMTQVIAEMARRDENPEGVLNRCLAPLDQAPACFADDAGPSTVARDALTQLAASLRKGVAATLGAPDDPTQLPPQVR
ncbi:hypothetical protein Salmuc_03049 [Salipiger mucosus DSM 16094]|uniref:Uncharacterized protein n=2 Tax=Salipiger mucosus TaxID=263378 RepID=S9QRJ6_9RHOB|nr:hypothetical protein Salmuc_03049 [Salipiger mucosus DSM 16094]